MIAKEMLAWETIGPRISKARKLIEPEVKADTRKLMTFEAFQKATDDQQPARQNSLREFCEKRATYLLSHEAIKTLPIEIMQPTEVSGSNKNTEGGSN